MRMATSPFLEIPAQNWIASNNQAFAVFDGFPVSVGHALVITRRVVPTWFDATADEQSALMELVNVVKRNSMKRCSRNLMDTSSKRLVETSGDHRWDRRRAR